MSSTKDASLARNLLPCDLLLEIVARTDAATLFRCAAVCKPLRRKILRVFHGPGGVVPPRVFGFLQFALHPGGSPPACRFSPAYPVTRAAASFSENHLAPSMSRAGAAILLNRYEPLASRNGLIVLHRRYIGRPEPDLVVYDPSTGDRAFLRDPPDIGRLSTTATSICSSRSPPSPTTASTAPAAASSSSPRTSTTSSTRSPRPRSRSRPCLSWTAPAGWSWAAICEQRRSYRASLEHARCGPVVHWLVRGEYGFHVLTYDVRKVMAGSMELAPDHKLDYSLRWRNVVLASMLDRKLSYLVADDRLRRISVWLRSSSSPPWELHAVIDVEKSLLSSPAPRQLPLLSAYKSIEFETAEGVRYVSLRPLASGLYKVNRKGEIFLGVAPTEDCYKAGSDGGYVCFPLRGQPGATPVSHENLLVLVFSPLIANKSTLTHALIWHFEL